MAGPKNVSFTVAAEDKASAELKKVQNSLTELSGKWFDFGQLMKGLPGILAGISFTVIIKDLIEMGTAVDGAMRQIAASLPTGFEGLRELRDEIDKTAEASGRRIEEVRAAAAEIAKMGAASATDVAERLRVATELADATGMDLRTAAAGSTEVMRVFGLSASQLEQTMANMRDAAKGRVDVEELFNVFGRAAPQLQKLGVDADTASRALIALIERGFNAKKAGAFITQLDLEGIQQLAKEATTSGNALEQMRADAETVRDGADRLEQALKSRLSATMEELGTKILPLVLGGLQLLNNALDLAMGRNWGEFASNIAKFGPFIGMAVPLTGGAASGASGSSFGGGGGFAGRGSSGDFGGDGSGTGGAPRGNLPLTEAEKAKAEAAAQAIAALRIELGHLNEETATGVPQWQQFQDKIDNWKEKAEKAKMSSADLNAGLASLNATLDQIKTQAADKAFSDAMTSAIQLTGSAVDKLNEKFQQEIANLEKERDLQIDPAKRAAIQAQIDQLTAYQPVAVALSAALTQSADAYTDLSDRIRQDKDNLAGLRADTTAAAMAMTYWSDQVESGTLRGDDLRKAIDELRKYTDLHTTAIQAQNSALDATAAKNKAAAAEIEKHRQAVLKTATEYANFARSAIAAGQASGAFSASLAATLQNVVSLTDGVTRLFSAMGAPGGFVAGGGIGAIVSVITSIGAIGQSISQTSAMNAQAAQQFADATVKWQQGFDNLMASIGASGFDKQKQALAQQFQSVMDQAIQSAATAIKNSPAATFGATGVGILGKTVGTVPGAGTIQDLDAYIAQIEKAQGTGKNVAQDRDLATLLEQLKQIRAGYAEAAAALAAAQALQTKEAEADLNIRNLTLQGKTVEAAIAAKAAADFKEMQAAIDQYGAGSQYVKDLKAEQEAEEAAAAAAAKLAAQEQALTKALSDVDTAAKVLGLSSTEVLQRKFAEIVKIFPEFTGMLDGLDLSSKAGLDALEQHLRDLFKSVTDGTASLPDGTKIDDLIQAILTLLGAADTAAGGIQTAAQQIAAAVQQLNQDFDVMGTSLPDQAQQIAKAEGIDLSRFDLTTADGIAGAEAYLRGLYKDATDPATKTAIQATIDAVYKIPAPSGASSSSGLAALSPAIASAAASASVQGLASFSYAQGDSITSILAQTSVWVKDIRDWALGTRPGGAGGPVTATVGQIGPIYVSGVADSAGAAAGAHAGVDAALADLRVNLRAAVGAPRTS